jgi:hypothetical protein
MKHAGWWQRNFRAWALGTIVAGALTAACGSERTVVGLHLIDTCEHCAWGEVKSVEAYAVYSDGEHPSVTYLATWTSSDENVATVTPPYVYRVSPGHVKITATYEGVSGSLELDVP